MKKTILALWHSSNKGKTQTLRLLAELLLSTYPKCKIIVPIENDLPLDKDFRIIIELKGKIIAIESQGDPYTGLTTRLQELALKIKCDIIICATRTKGETIEAVDDLYYSKKYDVIWTSTYQVASDYEKANSLKAKHMLDLLQTYNLI